MIIRVHFNLLLAVLLIQWCKNESKICQEAIVSSVKSVPKCPTLKENWDIAAKKKNCFEVASRKQCSTAEKYKYHCVINSYRNETMEVCAHNLLILGNSFIWFKKIYPYFNFVTWVAQMKYYCMFCTSSCLLDRFKTFEDCVWITK